MKIDKIYIPANDRVFGIMFEDGELYKALIKALFNEEITLLEKPRSQAHNQNDVLVSKVWFDTLVLTNKGYYSIDMQRKTPVEKRLENRIVYYTSRLIGHQDVKKMKYETLKPVVVSFVMQEAKSKNSDGIRYVSLHWDDTNENFSDLMKIAVVYVPTVLKKFSPDSDLYIFADFFAIETPEQADKFENDFGKTELGVKLMSEYARSICDMDYLNSLAKSPYYSEKEIEEMRNEDIAKARAEAKAEARAEAQRETRIETSIEIAKNLLKKGLSLFDISDVTGLSEKEIMGLA
jgi:predicted transposase/invertase (TIGR01784 family)